MVRRKVQVKVCAGQGGRTPLAAGL